MRAIYNFTPTLCNCGATIPHSVIGNALGMHIHVYTYPECILRERIRQQRLCRCPLKRLPTRPKEGGKAWKEEIETLRREYGHYEKQEEDANDAEPEFE